MMQFVMKKALYLMVKMNDWRNIAFKKCVILIF